LRIRASLYIHEDRVEEAETLLEESMSKANDIGALSWRLRAANDLAQSWRARSKVREARDMLLPIYGAFNEGFET
jgi:hypothetical protein